MGDWVPTMTGTAFLLRRCMEPLAPFRDDINVLSGIDLDIHGAGGGTNGAPRALPHV